MIHSFLLIGQSNMAGRGFLTEAKDIDTEHIKIMRNGLWIKMFRPINCDRSFSGVNLAESFAEKYARTHGVDVGLICCADGGTRLEQWAPGSILFDNALHHAKLAMRTSTLAGVLWHQGEGDMSPERYSTYQKRFEIMMEAFRRELGLFELPFLVGGLGEYLGHRTIAPPETIEISKNYFHVNDQLQSLARDNDRVGYVSSAGLTANPDELHFNAASLYEFGLRYYDAYEEICKKYNISLPTSDEIDTSRTALEQL